MGETNGDPVASAFGSMSDEEKRDNFDVSTSKLILKQLGIPSSKINRLEDELGPAFGSDWINTHILNSEDAYVWTSRCFKYDFNDFLLNPDKADLLDDFMAGPIASGEKLYTVNHVMVFKHHAMGRFVISNYPYSYGPSIYIPGWTADGDSAHIVPFKDYFRNQFGDNFGYKLL